MIEDTRTTLQNDLRDARRKGVAPSSSLRRHFYALARQVTRWADTLKPTGSHRGPAIGVTSIQSGAGKSTVSYNLAVALKSIATPPILLVESDLGRHYITRKLGLARSPGLSELLLGEASIEETVFETPITNLSILGSGRKSDQEALDLPFENLGPIIEEHLDNFNYLVFDLPLASQLTTCQAIVPFLDGVILTVEANQIDRQQIKRVQQQFKSNGIEIIG
ncbi:MAG: CpsD/CapB family tyrosine-protein kinase, partial [Planctomycetota bacterium]